MSLSETTTWLDRIAAESATAEAQYPEGGDSFQPHQGDETDANLFYADLLGGPDPDYDTGGLERPRAGG